MTTRPTSVLLKPWCALATAAIVALGGISAAQASTNLRDASGTNTHINNSNCSSPYNALQLNATRTPRDGTPPYNGNLILAMSDVTYWYPYNNCWESTTWTSNGTGRKAAKVTGVYQNPNPTSVADIYLPIDRFIKLRNLTIDNVDLDYDNTALWFFTSGATPAQDLSLTLNNGSITGFNPPTFDSRARFNLNATGDSSITNWWTRIDVRGTTTLNVTGAGSKLTLFRVGSTSVGNANALYFDGAGNTALIDSATLKLDQSSVTFGMPAAAPDVYGRMMFQNNATLELAGADTKLQSGEVSFVNSRLAMGLGRTRLTVDAGLSLNGVSAAIAGSGKVTTPVLDVLSSNTIDLPSEYTLTDYTMLASMVVMQPDSSLTLSGQGSLASDFQLRWSFAPSGHYGQITINDDARLVNSGGIFRINPGAPISISRTSAYVSGHLVVKNGGTTELLGSNSSVTNFINQGELEAYDNGVYTVPAGTFNILGGSQGLIGIGDEGGLTLGNVGTATGATAILNTDNRVELNSFSTLRLTIDPTARRNSQLRTSSDLFISNFATLNLSLVNDQVLPVGTRLILMDYASLSGTGGVPGVANRYFTGYPNGSSFLLGLNRYQINYHDSGDAYAAAVTLTVVPMVVSSASLTPTLQTLSGTVGVSLTPSATMVPGGFGGAVTYSINPVLPSHLGFDTLSGVISGVPGAALAATPFTIRGTGATGGDATVTLTLTIGKGSQTITFYPPSAPTGTPLLMTATSTSGLPVMFASQTPAVCTTSGVNGSMVTVVSPRTCTIRASQDGNANYDAALPVDRSFSLSQATTQLSLTSSANPAAYGAPIVLSIVVPGANPTGQVDFTVTYAGTGGFVASLCSGVTLVGGAARCNVPGAYQKVSPLLYQAVYSGDADHPGATATLVQMVSLSKSTLTVKATPRNPVAGQSVLLNALVVQQSLQGAASFHEHGAVLPGCSAVALASVGGSADSAVAACRINGLTAGEHTFVVNLADPAGAGFEQVSVTVNVAGGGPRDYTDLWWGGMAENGWSVTVEQRGTTQFIMLQVYDNAGNPVWYGMPSGSWNGTTNVYSGALYQPTSSPYNAYDAWQFNVNAPVGSATLAYNSESTATLSYTINGLSGSKQIVREPYGVVDEQPLLVVDDMWWGGDQEIGWGLIIDLHGKMLFARWYTYDAAGNPTYYVVFGESWNGTTVTGDLYHPTSSAWLGVPYDAKAFNPNKVGAMSIAFDDQDTATMTYTLNGETRTSKITRQPY